MIRALLALCLAAPAAMAGPVEQVAYDEIARRAHYLVDFETHPTLPEPGQSVDAFRVGPVLIGEHLQGQIVGESSVDGNRHDVLVSPGDLAQTLLAQPRRGQNYAVAYHQGFGSNAAFPLGPAGFPRIEAMGEGALSLQIIAPAAGIGVKVHSDYPDPLGQRPPPGSVQVFFYAGDGRLVDRHDLVLTPGVNPFGFHTAAGGITGVTITNTDPGGIAIDDIVVAVDGLSG